MSMKEHRPAPLYAVPLRHALIAACALFIAAACTDQGTPHPTEPGDTPPSDTTSSDTTSKDSSSTAGLLVSDGAHAGNPHFFFLPPLAATPTHSGTADGTLSPTVDVCDIGTAPPTATAQCAGAPVARFATTAGTDSGGVHYNATTEQYAVAWPTDHSSPALQHGHYYRVSVRVAGTLLGYADVTPAKAAGTMYTAGDTVELVDGRTLPIRFRIEQAAVYVVGAAGGRVESPDVGLSIDIPEGALTADLGITVTKVSGPTDSLGAMASAMVRLGPEGVAFAQPVTLTFSYDPATRPPGPEANELVVASARDSGWEVHADERPDTIAHTVRAFTTHFSDWDVFWVPVYFTDLSSGGGPDTCGISTGGGVWCWGWDQYDQLGAVINAKEQCGTDACVTAPSFVNGLPGTSTQVATGPTSTCSLDHSQSSPSTFMWCWGTNTGSWGSSNYPSDYRTGVPVLAALYCSASATCTGGGFYVTQINMGFITMCAIGSVVQSSLGSPTSLHAYCTGNNQFGEAGYDPSVPYIDGWNAISIGSGAAATDLVTVGIGSFSACGLDATGGAYCWGRNDYDDLGIPAASTQQRCTVDSIPCSSRPVAVAGGLRFTKLAVGDIFCGLTVQGEIYCWGPMLTSSGTTEATAPRLISGTQHFEDVSVSRINPAVCGLGTDGQAYCQGYNHFGMLGTGDTVSSSVFRPVAGGHQFKVLRVYSDHVCAIDTYSPVSTTYCWGRNNVGQLGDGTTTDHYVPTPIKPPGFYDIP